ncbi:MAG: complex I subunit 5 family protein [Candidatus Wenzhouxiangella sp. M2_3B_020]
MSVAVLLPLPFVLPLVGAALLPALFLRRPGPAWAAALAFALATTASAIALTAMLVGSGANELRYAVGGWPAPLGIELRFDSLSAITVVFGAVTALVVVFSRTVVGGFGPRPALFHALVLINLGGLNGFAMAGDLFNLFVFMELLSVSAYALVASARGRHAALAALKYLLAGAVSSLLVLLAVGVLFALTGSLNMAAVGTRLSMVDAPGAAALALAALAAGFMVKAALFPLHFWLPDAHGTAPGPVSALLSGLVINVGIVGLVRVLMLFDEAARAPLEGVLVVLGAVAVLVGAVAAMVQHELKRLLAYSTISNVGYIALGLGLANPASIAGALAHVFYHGLTKAGVFLAAAALVEHTGLRNLDDLRGLGHRMPWTATALSAGMVALAGVPPTAAFVGKWQIALGALQAGRPVLVAVVLGGALLALGYGIRVINALFFRSPTHAAVVAAVEAPPSMRGPLIVLVGIALSAGLTGAAMISFLRPLAEALGGR